MAPCRNHWDISPDWLEPTSGLGGSRHRNIQMANQLRIDGYLKSIGYCLLGFSEELLNSGMSLLTELRSSIPEWLETILRFIYNSGGFLVSV